MPFAVFRRHQRKLLAICAILAMFGFVVADSLPRLLNGGAGAGGDPVVATLYNRPIRRNDIRAMIAERNNANLFMAELNAQLFRRQAPAFFGDLTTKSIVDALVLQHEADRLAMPVGPDVARDWLKQRAGAAMTRDLFEQILARFPSRIGGEQLLTQISNQIRLTNVRFLLGAPIVTPLDVFETYRDQNERVSARAVGFPVQDFVKQVPDPSTTELQAFFDASKDTLPDPDRPTPGFKIPRLVQVEILSLDGKALAEQIRDKLTDAELRSYYENRKAEFKKPSDFPAEIFQGAPELTPPITQTFEEVVGLLKTSLADEKAQTEIINTFGQVKDEVMIPFADKYLKAVDEAAEAKKAGAASGPNESLPKPDSLKAVADKEHLGHEITGLLTRDRAEHYGPISEAEQGLTRYSGGRRFAEELFASRSALFEPIELTDGSGTRYLIRKLQDQAPRVPALDEVRAEVVAAWKTERARPLARKAAEALAAKIKAAGGKIEGSTVEGRPVLVTGPVSKLQPGRFLPGTFETGPPTPSEIPRIPSAGPALRDAYFSLTPAAPAVAPNRPETVYYVLALDRRFPVSMKTLYKVFGDYDRYRQETMFEAYKKRDEVWMNELRAQAGLPRGWVPSDEAKTDSESTSEG